MRIREPTADRHRVLRVKYVRSRRVVNNYGIFEIPADLGEVLDVVSLVIITTLTEQSVVNDLVYIELVKKRVAVLFGLVRNSN